MNAKRDVKTVTGRDCLDELFNMLWCRASVEFLFFFLYHGTNILGAERRREKGSEH